MGNLLRVSEAAERLGLSVFFIYRLVETGQIPVIRIGRALRFDPQELNQWVDERRCRGRR